MVYLSHFLGQTNTVIDFYNADMRHFFAFEMWAPRNNKFVLLLLAGIPLVCFGWTAYKSLPPIKSATDIPLPVVLQSEGLAIRFEYLRSDVFTVAGRHGIAAVPERLDERDCDVCPETAGCYCIVIPEPFFRDIGFDYIPWDARQIYVDGADLDWESLQADYARILRLRGFAPHAVPADFSVYDNIAIWERSRYGGLEGELIAVAWVDAVETPYVIVIFGIDY